MKSWYLEPFNFTFYFTTNVKDIKNEKVKYKFQEDMAKSSLSAGICHMDDEHLGAYILVLPDKEIQFPELVDIVSHEAYHAVSFLYEALEDSGTIQANSEVPAYLQGWLTGKIIEALGYE